MQNVDRMFIGFLTDITHLECNLIVIVTRFIYFCQLLYVSTYRCRYMLRIFAKLLYSHLVLRTMGFPIIFPTILLRIPFYLSPKVIIPLSRIITLHESVDLPPPCPLPTFTVCFRVLFSYFFHCFFKYLKCLSLH